jgi:hypothetical protein
MSSVPPIKRLKFAPHLIPLIRGGFKTVTWRLWDDKNLAAGDQVEFVDASSLDRVGLAELTKVYTKTFAALDDADWQGHERFRDDADMFQHYTRYYGRTVDIQTPVTVVHFTMLNFAS